MLASQSKAAWKFGKVINNMQNPPPGVVDILIKSIWMCSKMLCTLIGCKCAHAVWAYDFVYIQVLQCFRRNATSWHLMVKNYWFNTAKVLFMPEWIELIWCSWTIRSKTISESITQYRRGWDFSTRQYRILSSTRNFFFALFLSLISISFTSLYWVSNNRV